jgi:hypothetical protein
MITTKYEVDFFFAWYDFWIGLYYDRFEEVLYICPLPMVVIRIQKRTNEVLR